VRRAPGAPVGAARGRGYLCVHLLDDFSGSAKMCAEVASILAEAGHAVDVWVGSAGRAGFVRDRHPAATKFFYRTSGSKAVLLAYLLASQAILALRTFVYCAARRPDAVYVSTVLPFGAMVGARLARTRVVCHVHEVSLGTRALFVVLDRIVRTLATDVICVSRYVAARLGYHGERAHVIHNSLGAAEWARAGAIAHDRAPAPHRPLRVVMACSLKWYKGLDSFLALAALARSRGRAIEFEAILNCEREAFDRFAAKHAASNVGFVWRPRSVYDHYARADLLLNLSHPEACVESFGLTLLEGMACGLPVVAPEVGGCVELFEEGVGGWRVASRQLAAITALLERLQDDAGLWRQASLAARTAAARFSPDVFRRQLLSVLAPENASAERQG
jgi:glycosyltransferase involved in cell wall biosynthesis